MRKHLDRQFHLHVARYGLAVVLAAILVNSTGIAWASPPRQATLEVRIMSPLRRVCVGDKFRMPFLIVSTSSDPEDIPLVPLFSTATVSARLGSVTPSDFSFNGMIGGFTYTAEHAGAEELMVTVDSGIGKGVGRLQLEVLEGCDYRLDFLAQESKSQQGAGVIAIFSGTGAFHRGALSTEGKGTANFNSAVWIKTEELACAFTPPVRGRGSFDISGEENFGSQSGPSGRFRIGLHFSPITLNSTNMICQATGGINVNQPLPGSQTDPNTVVDFEFLIFPLQGGTQSFAFGKGNGTVTATRLKP